MMNLDDFGFPCKPSGLYIMKKADFDIVAIKVLEEKQPCVLEKAMPLDLYSLAEEQFPLTCHDAILSREGSILGLITFSEQKLPIYDDNFEEAALHAIEGTILIDKRLKIIPTRYRFTLAHEISHWILHRRFYSAINRSYNFRNSGNSYIANRQEAEGRKNPIEAKTDFEWSEWQSDCLSAAMLMPVTTFVPTASQVLYDFGFQDLKLMPGVKDDRTTGAIDQIAKIYNVSHRSVSIRLSTYGFYKQ